MRDLTELNKFRVTGADVIQLWGWAGDGTCGFFMVPYPRTGVKLKVVASSGEGWDHVSVSLPNRCPNWLEMEFIKRMFFGPTETAFQLHVPPADHISVHPYCLHIWRPQQQAIPVPPAWMVG